MSRQKQRVAKKLREVATLLNALVIVSEANDHKTNQAITTRYSNRYLLETANGLEAVAKDLEQS